MPFLAVNTIFVQVKTSITITEWNAVTTLARQVSMENVLPAKVTSVTVLPTMLLNVGIEYVTAALTVFAPPAETDTSVKAVTIS